MTETQILAFPGAQKINSAGGTASRSDSRKRTGRSRKQPIGFNYMADMEDRLAAPNTLAGAVARMLHDMAMKASTDDPNFHQLIVLASSARQCADLISGCADYAGMCALAASKGDPQ